MCCHSFWATLYRQSTPNEWLMLWVGQLLPLPPFGQNASTLQLRIKSASVILINFQSFKYCPRFLSFGPIWTYLTHPNCQSFYSSHLLLHFLLSYRSSFSSSIIDYLILSYLSLICILYYLILVILSYLILSYLILSYLILSYLILSYLIWSYLILSYLILSYLFLSYLILSYLIVILSYLVLDILSCLVVILSYLYLILS